ncbi:unnamed protein product [Dimorphilus gyrociliatus]|uniref:DUF1279 domain-containing protein n=1 Tax=Dimorphilus gyrociliatus TaxID=2664684 RepID=A0A7I8VMV3_9ANNE|nr:unnamed protein product [Dimorphilus gyrociliatus]
MLSVRYILARSGNKLLAERCTSKLIFVPKSWKSSNDEGLPISKPFVVEGFQGQEHGEMEFLSSKTRELSGQSVDHQAQQGIQEQKNNESDDSSYTSAYRSQSNVNLYSTMQSNVPEPFCSSQKGNPTHLNMPGGGSHQREKFMYNKIQSTHPSKNFSTSASPPSSPSPPEQKEALSSGQKLKMAVRDYGSTVVVFHIGIALVSLGGFYSLVSLGVPVESALQALGFKEKLLESGVLAGASTFVVAYSIHKLFAPVRIGITLTCAPFIVKSLRARNILKPPVKKS